MTRAEFEEHFGHVSESHKREGSDRTDKGRPKIGRIGIGFIAANELCDVMEIVSTKKGSTELMRVEINFAEMREPPESRRRNKREFLKADYEGVVESAPRDEHYTQVLLREVRPTAKGILTGARVTRTHTHGELSAYGKKTRRVRAQIAEADDWSDFDEYSQAMLQVGLNVPVRYLPDWYPEAQDAVLRPFERRVSRLAFSVFYDGSELRKPVVLDPGERNLARLLEIKTEHTSVRGYMYAKRRALRPRWLNGVLIRIRNAAVGEYDATFLGFKATEGPLFQSWITCELWADDGLEEALNIDRRTLRVTHPAYVELQERFHEELATFIADVRRKLYGEPAARRKTARAAAESDRLVAVIESASTQLRPTVRRELARTVNEHGAGTREVRRVLQQYSVAELYELALEVARDTLNRTDYERFARALASRLLG
jgi:hypothetical protein